MKVLWYISFFGLMIILLVYINGCTYSRKEPLSNSEVTQILDNEIRIKTEQPKIHYFLGIEYGKY